MFNLRQVFFVAVMLVANPVYAQVILEDYVFDEPPEEPINEREYPESVLGVNALIKFLQDKISNGDTLGKKYTVYTWNIRFRVNQRGKVDTTYIFVKHGCAIHEEAMKFLKETQWYPATKEGKPISLELDMYDLHFNKNVLKRYNCWRP